MSECGIEYSLRDDGLENDLHGRMNDGLDGCTLSRSKMGCCSNACDHNLGAGWLVVSWWVVVVVESVGGGFEGAGKSVAGLGRAGSSRSAGGLSGGSLGAATVGGRVSGAAGVISPGKTE